MGNKNKRTKEMVSTAMLCAIAYTSTVVITMVLPPVVKFPPLYFDPKDIVILFGGFIFGPFTALIMSVIVAFLEMFTISETGIVGCIMNIVSSCSFTCVASFIYHRRKTLEGATIGLIAGVISVTIVMALWNYIFAPIFMASPQMSSTQWREIIKGMLLPVFVPFNLFKSGVNAVVTMLLFKPVVTALHKSDLIPPMIVGSRSTKIKWIFVAAGFVAVTLILLFAINPPPPPPA